jgi:hypothetical protein
LPHRGVGRHAGIGADLANSAATRQLLQNPVGDLRGAERGAAAPGVAGVAGLPVARRKTFAIVAHPFQHRVEGGHAAVPAHRAQRTAAAQLAENPLGEFGGMDGAASSHDGSLVKWCDRFNCVACTCAALAIPDGFLSHTNRLDKTTMADVTGQSLFDLFIHRWKASWPRAGPVRHGKQLMADAPDSPLPSSEIKSAPSWATATPTALLTRHWRGLRRMSKPRDDDLFCDHNVPVFQVHAEMSG